jgi:putative heme iron utilization protein
MAATQEPDYYNAARLLIRNAKTATLATAQAGVPHAALVTVATLADLTPILLLSQLAVHTRQLQANPACALLLTGEPSSENPQTAPRICLSGAASKTADPKARANFLDRHPYAALYVDFADFEFWQVVVSEAYYIGGFAAASRLDFAKIAAPSYTKGH